MRRMVLLAGTLMAALLVLAACGGGEKSALASIPANASLLGSVQPKKALQDKQLQDLFASAAKDSDLGVTDLNSVVTAFEKQSGVDLRQIDEITFVFVGDLTAAGKAVGGAGSAIAAPGFSGVAFFKGSFDRSKVIASMKQERGRTPNVTSYKGQEIVMPEKDTALAFLQSDLFAIGNEAGVKAAIDVRKGDSPEASGPFVRSFNNLRDPLVKISAAVPKDAIQNALAQETGNSAIQLDPQLFADVHTVSFTANKQGDKVAITLLADYSTADNARRAREGLAGLLQFFKSFGGQTLQKDPGLARALDSIRIINLGSQLSITLSVTTADLKDTIEGLQSLSKSFGDLQETGPRGKP